MTSHYRHRRFANPAINFVTSEPGEISANTANRQLAIGDAATASAGTPLPLLAVRYFDARAQYALGDFVVQGGQLYRALATVAPGAFNAASWQSYSSDQIITAYVDGADADITTAYTSADTTLQTNIDAKVAKAGDSMSGPLSLAADPTTNNQAATKHYVDVTVADATGSATAKVSKSGDTMTGPLVLSGDPTIAMHAATKSYVDNKDLSAYLPLAGGTMTGVLTLSGAPTGDLQAATKQYVDGKVGSVTAPVDGALYGMQDGVWTPGVKRSGDEMTGALRVDSYVMSAEAAAGGTYYFGFGGVSYMQLLSGTYTLNGGHLKVNGNIAGTDGNFSRGDGTGAVYLGGGSAYIYYNGGSFQFGGGNIIVPNGVAAGTGDVYLAAAGGNVFFRPYGAGSPVNQAYVQPTGSLALTAGSFQPPHNNYGGFACKSGTANVLTGNYFNMQYSVGQMMLFADSTYMGNIMVGSDYRIKKDVSPLPSMWETVKALRPIKYTHADFTPPIEKKKRDAEGSGPFVLADDIERWGFAAHELQETLVESAASGRKDMPDGIQSPNSFTVIAALTKALQEAMARIEALEQA